MAATYTSYADGDWSDIATWGPPYSIESITTATKTILVASDATATLSPGDRITVVGTTGGPFTLTIDTITFDDPDATEIVYLSTMEPIVDGGGTGTVSKAVPAGSDDVTVQNDVTVDINLPALNTLTVSGGHLIGDNDNGKFVNIGTIHFNSGGSLIDVDAGSSVYVDTSSSFENCNITGGVTVTGSNTLTWSGTCNPASGFDLAGYISGEGPHAGDKLVVGISDSSGTITCSGGGLKGTIDVAVTLNFQGNSSSLFFGGSGGTIRLLVDTTVEVNDGVYLGGTIQVFHTFTTRFVHLANNEVDIQLMNKSARYIGLDDSGNELHLTYVGPNGGSMGNFSLSL